MLRVPRPVISAVGLWDPEVRASNCNLCPVHPKGRPASQRDHNPRPRGRGPRVGNLTVNRRDWGLGEYGPPATPMMSTLHSLTGVCAV